ncbi:PXPV repeat protein [Caballeronia sp. LjRoot34]|uniref:PXPV repeat protein n=1 Tax=Caballeronia sp. LjRoot34 TaxID=3342325 RepID=UPI003ECFC4EE
MKRIVTHLLVAAGLAMDAVGAAQAHTDLSIGLSLGVPGYVQPGPVYVQPAPFYRAPPPTWGHRDDRWGGPDRGHWNRTGWDHGGYGHDGWNRRG